jgi:hypothetical protein
MQLTHQVHVKLYTSVHMCHHFTCVAVYCIPYLSECSGMLRLQALCVAVHAACKCLRISDVCAQPGTAATELVSLPAKIQNTSTLHR